MKDNQFDIPSHNLNWAIEKIEKINKKAKKLGFTPFNLNTIKEYQAERTSETGYTYTYKRYIVEIDNPNKMVIGGWKLLAHTEYLNGSNIVSRIDLNDDTDLSVYRNKIECNHCGINHKRKYTYILKNTDSNELKQVGTACVKDFTGHDPKYILRLAEMFSNIKESLSEDDDGITGSGRINGFYLVEYLAKTINYLRIHPYISKTKAYENFTTSTATIINFSYESNAEIKITPDKKDFLSAKKIINYFRNYKKIKSKTDITVNDYYHNLINIINNDYIDWKFDGYITSMYPSYLREKKWKANNSTSDNNQKSMWIQNIGDKIEKNVKLVFRTSFETVYGLSHLYKFIDKNGNILIWTTGINIDNCNTDNDNGNTDNDNCNTDTLIKGTIKKHNEYGGEKQTVLTRCKLIRKNNTKC